jgi:hypothetical protein
MFNRPTSPLTLEDKGSPVQILYSARFTQLLQRSLEKSQLANRSAGGMVSQKYHG